VIDYRSQPAVDEKARRFMKNLADPVRDIYVPVGLLVVGFLGALVWVIAQTNWGAPGLILVSVVTAVTTLVKTIAVVVLAFALAPALGISFGTYGSAILKFVAIIVFIDSARLWLEVIMQSTGALPASGRGAHGSTLVDLLFTFALAAVALYFLFGIDDSESRSFIGAMAFAIVFLDLVLAVVAHAAVHAVVTAARPRPAAAPAPAVAPVKPPTVAATKPATPLVIPTAADQEITRRVRDRSAIVMEGREWRDKFLADNRSRRLVEQMYGAGARKVYVDVLAGGSRQTPKMYVELPLDPAAARQCVEASQEYLRAVAPGQAPPTSSPATRQYLVVELKLK
jgi:hypothetical protein